MIDKLAVPQQNSLLSAGRVSDLPSSGPAWVTSPILEAVLRTSASHQGPGV